jgi:hypothetical protein
MLSAVGRMWGGNPYYLSLLGYRGSPKYLMSFSGKIMSWHWWPELLVPSRKKLKQVT